MSQAHYTEPIECPECGDLTYLLYSAVSLTSGQKSLMCESCYGEENEGFTDLDESWFDNET